MDQELAFLAAIRARPGSKADRLVYADWLTDRGDPRGEFMRLHIQGKPEANELLFRHEEEWLTPFLPFAGNWSWKDGMLEFVTVETTDFLANAPRWLPRQPLLGLHLRRPRKHVSKLAKCKQLRHVSALFLGDNDLQDKHLATLLGSPHLRRLRELYLQSNNLTAEGMKALAGSPNLPRLRVLVLGHNMLGDEGVIALAGSSRLTRLRMLDLTMTGVKDTGVRALAGSALLARLTSLRLGMNLLPAGTLAELTRSPNFATLRELGFGMNDPELSDYEAVAHSPQAANLRFLGLDGYQTVNDGVIRAIAGATSLKQVRNIYLGSGEWTPEGFRELMRSQALPALRTLSLLQSNEQPPNTETVVFGSPLIRRLHWIDFNVRKIGVRGMRSLASHPSPLRLQKIRLPMTPATAGPVAELLKKGGLRNLTNLVLIDAPPAAVRAELTPERLPKLRTLHLVQLSSVPDDFEGLLSSPLFRQLETLNLDVTSNYEEKADDLLRELIASWKLPHLNRLGLLWSLTTAQVRILTSAAPPPRLTELCLGSLNVKAEGIRALAGWPGLRQIRRLEFRNASSNAMPAMDAFAESPHAGPLLRIDVTNGHIPQEPMPALRKRFGMRVAMVSRSMPRATVLGGWGRLLGDGKD